MGYCSDCGCKKYNGACTNCHEEIYIAQQYHDNGDSLPHENTEFTKKLRECEKQIQEGEG
jgi:hypothetical protein